MKLHFSLEYGTKWGESVHVEISQKKFTGRTFVQSFPLDTQDGLCWSGDVTLSARDVKSFSYEYLIMAGDHVVRREWNVVKREFPAREGLSFKFPDYWRDVPPLSHTYSSAYTRCVSHFLAREPQLIYFDRTIIFRLQAPQLAAGQVPAVIGSQPPIGAWNLDLALRMNPCGVNEWVIAISADGLTLPFEYKYVVLDEQSGKLLKWEDGANRVCGSNILASNSVLLMYDKELRTEEELWRTAGVVVPVFSLRSEHSQGVGDFHDLRLMVDWAVKTRMHVIQLLPIYDTTQTHGWTDSYPYCCISIYALHPMYLDLSQLPALMDEDYMRSYEEKRRELNALSQVDYVQVSSLKTDYLRRLYNQCREEIKQSADYHAFYEENREWLVPYTAFCMLRDRHCTADFNDWGEYAVYDIWRVQMLVEKNEEEAGFYAYVQYLLDKQLSETVRYARANNIVLKGDIPIGISRSSVEAWTEPYYFNMNGQAGAPPDDFSVMGQNWGFPTYNWARMAEDGYSWWAKRFRRMSAYFDAYRVDHVLGFFRIWEIPQHSVHGLLGQFVPALPLTPDEMRDFGLNFDEELMTKPYITDDVLENIFGKDAERVRELYLQPEKNGRYSLKPEYATQRQVEQAFADAAEDDIRVRDGLYSLINNVLFVPDHQREGVYHPRISVMNDFVFRALPWQDQEAFLQLYNHYFYYRHNEFWYHQAMQKLPTLVNATPMLPCAEDLGMVPACVGSVMDQLRMLSLEIQSMPKQPGLLFGNLEDNPYLSVATIFTHDMPTLREWWEEDAARAAKYYAQALKHEGDAPAALSAQLCREILEQHLLSPSMLCLISLQDWMSVDEQVRRANPYEERINIPSVPNHYWRYRMHLTIEQLLASEDFCATLAKLIHQSGRA